MSNIIGVGTDIIEIERIKDAIDKNPKFLSRVFTSKELEYVLNHGENYNCFAGIFAAKEAAVKACGGLITDYEILHLNSGKPYILHNSVDIKVSISHCNTYATAFVIATKKV